MRDSSLFNGHWPYCDHMDNGSIVFAFFGLPLGMGLVVGSVIVVLGALMRLAWIVNRLAVILMTPDQ